MSLEQGLKLIWANCAFVFLFVTLIGSFAKATLLQIQSLTIGLKLIVFVVIIIVLFDFCLSKSSELLGRLSEPAGLRISFDLACSMAGREFDISEGFSEYFDELLLEEAAEIDCLVESAIGEDQADLGCGANSEKFMFVD